MVYQVLLLVVELVIKSIMAELVEQFCMEALPKCSMDFLTGLSEEYRITIPDDKKDNQSYLLKMVLRHLTSDAILTSEDGGAAIFLKLYQELGGELKVQSVKKEAVLPPLERDEESVTALSYHKLRQFKINGTIGDPGQKNCLSYSSLCYQIKQGEAQGYQAHEIYGGVIKAIEADNPLRELLELGADDFKKEAFLKTLRAHFKEQNPNAVFNELRTASQGPKENAHKFVCRCVALRKKVTNMASAEGMEFDEENLSATFYRTIYTGLRNKEIRNELRGVLREASMSAEDLLVEVSLAQANEEERIRKMMETDRKVDINKLTFESDSDSGDSSSNSSPNSSSTSASSTGLSKRQAKKQARQKAKANQNSHSNSHNNSLSNTHNNAHNNPPNTPLLPGHNSGATTLTPADINKMTAAFDRLSTSNAKLTAEVNILKNANKVSATSSHNAPRDGMVTPSSTSVNNNNVAASGLNVRAPVFNSRQVRNATRRPLYFCDNCIASNSFYCRHCFKCGRDDHKVKDCPEN